jgi:hypothetical protein
VSVPAEALHDQTLGELPAGLSGLTRLAEGGLLAVPERTREAVLFAPGGERVLGTVPITGAPEGLDLESVAWMGGDRVALGTESRAAGRVTDLVLLGRLSDDALALDGVIELSWAPFGMRAGSNHGIEGVCAADGTLVAVGEEVGNDQGRRFAPAWIRARQGGVVHTARLLLSSEKGKASGAACRIDAEGRIELHVLVPALAGGRRVRAGRGAGPRRRARGRPAEPRGARLGPRHRHPVDRHRQRLRGRHRAGPPAAAGPRQVTRSGCPWAGRGAP